MARQNPIIVPDILYEGQNLFQLNAAPNLPKYTSGFINSVNGWAGGSKPENVSQVSELIKNVDNKIEVVNENVGKVKDIAETSSSIANMGLQTALNQSVDKPGIISSVISGVSNLIEGLSAGIIGTLGLTIQKVSDGVEKIKDWIKYQGATDGSVKEAPGASE